jgi:hypothetical protein
MPPSHSPFSLRSILAGILISVASGVIIAYIIQDARFSPERSKPVSTETHTTSSSSQIDKSPRSEEDNKEPWVPGRKHSLHPNVIASEKEGTWTPAPGYNWVDKDARDDFRVVWSPGKEHSKYPHVIASVVEGIWLPAPGYVWVNKTADDLRVAPKE